MEQVRQVVLKKRSGELIDTRPRIPHSIGRTRDQPLPGRDSFHHNQDVANLKALQRGAFDASLVQVICGIKHPTELKTARVAQKFPHLGGALLLHIDPAAVARRLKGHDPRAAERRLCASSKVFAQTRPLQRNSGSLLEDIRNLRQHDHLYRIRAADF